jgi:molecular chaperone GrpE
MQRRGKKDHEAGPEPSVATETSEVMGGADPAPETQDEVGAGADLTGELGRAQAELAALNDRHLRLAAEYSNYRRRAENDLTEAWGRAQADLLKRFLDVLDDLQRVSALDPSDPAVALQTVVEGIDLVERKFARALEDAKVESVDPAAGDAFDPASMEAVLRVPSASAEDDDTVDQVFQKGYRFRNHLVRPARVSVRKHE